MISYMPFMRTLEDRGITLAEFESQLGLTESSLRQTMNRGGYLRLSTLLCIADKLQCTVGDLIAWQEGSGVENSTKYVEVDWEALSEICRKKGVTLTSLALKAGGPTNRFTRAKGRGSRMSPVDVEKVCSILGIDKGQIVK